MGRVGEFADLGDAATLVAERIVAPVEGMHRVISGRTFRYLGPPARPVHRAHDLVTGGVYWSLRRAAGVIGAGVGSVLSSRNSVSTPVSGSRRGSGIQAFLNAVWGDDLAERGNALAIDLTVRREGRVVGVDEESLAGAYQDAARHVVVLLHGLGQTERCWGSVAGEAHPGLLGALRADPTMTPVLVRYNSGLPVAGTGAAVADLINDLSESWPVADHQVSLVGYSMGGLVARGAYGAGLAAGHKWAAGARDLITIGAPHHGSAVARAVDLAARALRISRTSRPIGELLDTASAGIKDLQHGAGLDDERSIGGSGGRVGVEQHFVAAVITGDARHPFGILFGDLIVQVASASGHRLAPDNVHVLGSRRHFDLLADSEVLSQVVQWLRA